MLTGSDDATEISLVTKSQPGTGTPVQSVMDASKRKGDDPVPDEAHGVDGPRADSRVGLSLKAATPTLAHRHDPFGSRWGCPAAPPECHGPLHFETFRGLLGEGLCSGGGCSGLRNVSALKVRKESGAGPRAKFESVRAFPLSRRRVPGPARV